MGSKDGFSNNKLLDDFGPGSSNPARLRDVITVEDISSTLSSVRPCFGSTTFEPTHHHRKSDELPSSDVLTLVVLGNLRLVGKNRHLVQESVPELLVQSYSVSVIAYSRIAVHAVYGICTFSVSEDNTRTNQERLITIILGNHC
uniref:Uncharacterized protein n=1 Tax=Oryza sativa subsp. japonica TaxID=39947 RepID=Q69KE2_ORYSJ|nr:hypothetical protein [Oryza sativa Japonica Group]BAD36598.1 hypothetical protein [Oryza sativa Japonica Group]